MYSVTNIKTMKHIAFQFEGSLSVVIPTDPNADLNELAANVIPEGTPFTIIEDSEVDHDFFNAYEHDGEKVILNIEKAKELHLDKFREARKPKLQKLDVAFMKAVETADLAKQAEISTAKQALRDVTKTPLPDTLAELKSTWPEILN